jgi:hypothetical protein
VWRGETGTKTKREDPVRFVTWKFNYIIIKKIVKSHSFLLGNSNSMLLPIEKGEELPKIFIFSYLH